MVNNKTKAKKLIENIPLTDSLINQIDYLYCKLRNLFFDKLTIDKKRLYNFVTT
jgi:hypothetical protein